MIPCAAILAGGAGTRLQPVLGELPKALAPVAGRPFIYYLLDQLHDAGIGLVVICTGIGGDLIEQTLGSWYRDIKLVYSRESSPLGTGGALRNALPYFNSESVLVMNGDSYCEFSLTSFLGSSKEANMVLVRSENASRYGGVSFQKNGQIISFQEKNAGEWINAGIYLISKKAIGNLPENKKISLEHEIFPSWARQKKLWGSPVKASFIDIGTPESFETVQAMNL